MDPRLAIIPTLAFHAIVLSWINKLENKCECSSDWRRDYMKYFTMMAVVLSVVTTFILKPKPTQMFMIVGTAWVLASLVNLGSILSYIPALRKKQCECATQGDWRDDFIFWWVVASLVMAIVVPIILAARK